MNELEELRATRHSEAVDRYLSVATYRSAEPHRPAATTTRTGLVLVGADETPASYTAVDHAAIEAELRGWHLRILHAQRTAGLHRPTRDDGARLLERLIDRVHAYSPTVPVTSRMMVGSPAAHLLAEARAAGLVVVGHRHGTAGTMFGASVADHVATGHTGTVLVVRIPGWPPGPKFGERPIVVGMDAEGGPAVAFARREAALRGSDLVLVHADRTPRVESVTVVDGVTTYERFTAGDPAHALVVASRDAAALVVRRAAPECRTLLQRAYCPVFVVG
ncbi:hypothetical protein Ade02nite_71250 [Paractinoplanes deccanensis]|uniref:UspA domain-containing protein n=1 Tax=Paractinoplanes deccanensis TaxID=113561 RepID=A0ABQ3YES1_9ACTN|nr:universal stress protein [Actinoplanes deccanensis]GID78484.1 hypothetical protein Ade02nite_71250 [Actinoplanes deccanensis]